MPKAPVKHGRAPQRRSAGRRAAREQPQLDRTVVVRTALRLANERGLDQLTLRDVASELGITPAAVSWYVRNKNELVDAIMDSVLDDFAVPPAARGSWSERLKQLYGWLRTKLLANRPILGTAAFRRIGSLAFIQIAFAGRDILQQAGFDPAGLTKANPAIFFYVVGFTIHEMALSASFSPATTPRVAMARSIAALRPDDLADYSKHVPHLLAFDHDQLFEYGLDCLLFGMGKELERQRRRARRGR